MWPAKIVKPIRATTTSARIRREPGQLCDEVVRECAQRGFSGVVCDFPREPDPFLARFLEELDARLHRRGWQLHVPEWYAPRVRQGNVMISSALSGGSFRGRLEKAIEQYGLPRITLALQRMAEDFFLPAPKGCGKPLSREALKALMSRREPSVFFSNELCARYFTYMNSISDVHFVLFDDEDTFSKKIQIARELGVKTILAAYEEVDDISFQGLRP